jgi:uncharacterized protein (DUF1684 family)
MAIALAIVASGACKGGRPAADPAYAAEIEKRRAERLGALTGEDGWLTLVGIYWLKPGENRLGGGGAGNDIVLPGGTVPAFAGVITVEGDGIVTFRAGPGTAAVIHDETVSEAVLRTDRQGRPDVVEMAGLRMTVIDRSGSLALRVRNPRSSRRTAFNGIPYFPVDPRLRVEAALERYDAPREIAVASAQGPAQRMLAPGRLHFRVGATDCTLEPFAASAEAKDLFIVFSDATAGKQTYGAGRFLDAAAPAPGTATVVLDFNLAYNPPCAFTHYATCPLPPPHNVLPVRVAAGEMDPGGH